MSSYLDFSVKGYIESVNVWGIIPTNETANWVPVSDSEAANWTPVTTAETPDWVPVAA